MSDLTIDAISAAMRGLAARQGVIAQNLANTETPNYLAGRVSFEDSLASALSRGDASGVASTTPTTTNSTAPTNMQGNNVNIDDETVAMVETGLRYQLMAQAATNKYGILRAAIGRGV